MATKGGPNIGTDGLVLHLDAANPRGISPAANEIFNNSDQFVKNLSDISSTISANNGVKIGNLNYYTVFAIDYPENNYGNLAAGRDGITPGFNTTSGTKLFEYSRALHFHIWDNSANSFIPNSNFNGVGSFRYDSYSGYSNASTEVAQFITDYNSLKLIYPNDTYIIAGSHRDSFHTTAKLDILRDLGAPDNIDSLLDGAPEYILVGKPGLGAGNAYVWSFENYSIDPTQVAHAVFPLPINKVNKDNYFEFDGVDDIIITNRTLNTNDYSVEFVFKTDVNTLGVEHWLGSQYPGTGRVIFDLWTNNKLRNFNNGTAIYGNTLIDTDTWYHVIFTRNSSGLANIYLNGKQEATGTISTTLPVDTNFEIGASTTLSRGFTGAIPITKIYNRTLTAEEILQNYNATKSRFNL